MTTPQKQALALGVTENQLRAGLMRNAVAIRNYSEADLKRWGKTRKQANTIADDYTSRAQSETLKGK